MRFSGADCERNLRAGQVRPITGFFMNMGIDGVTRRRRSCLRPLETNRLPYPRSSWHCTEWSASHCNHQRGLQVLSGKITEYWNQLHLKGFDFQIEANAKNNQGKIRYVR